MEHSEHKPLHIIIVGAGIGGCTAAITLRQQGHHATLLDRSSLASELGAAIHLAPNAHGLVKRLGIDTGRDVGANECNWFTVYEADGTLKKTIPVGKFNQDKWEHTWLMAHRADLHSALKRKALEPEGQGPPASLLTSSAVVDVDCDNATVTLKSGEVLQADVVVGADGAHSTVRRFVAEGQETTLHSSGKSAFRWLMPRKILADDAATAKFAQKPGEMVLAPSEASNSTLVMYSCRDNNELNFVAIYPDDVGDSLPAGWGQKASKEALVKKFEGFGESFRAVLDKVDPETLKVWGLMDMNTLNSWTKGRCCLLGDAAHPFLPYLGQGGACAVEDAISLAIMLDRGLTPEQIPERLELYQACRIERADTLQQYTRETGKQMSGPAIQQTYTNYNFGHLQDTFEDYEVSVSLHSDPLMGRFTSEWSRCGYADSANLKDEHYHSSHKLQEWLAARGRKQMRFMPTGLGVRTIGPRGKDTLSEPRKKAFIRATVHFKTSRTYAQTLFPSQHFTFTAPNTMITASLTCIDRGPELGFHRRSMELAFHDVQFCAGGGSPSGSFIALRLETDPERAIENRELLGIPSLVCEMTTHQYSHDTLTMDARYMGEHIARCSFDALKDKAEHVAEQSNGIHQSNGDQPTNGIEDHISDKSKTVTKDWDTSTKPGGEEPPKSFLTYKYIPSLNGSQADAEYAIFIPNHEALEGFRVIGEERVCESSAARFVFEPGPWGPGRLVRGIARMMEDMPQLGVISGEVRKGQSADCEMIAKKLL